MTMKVERSILEIHLVKDGKEETLDDVETIATSTIVLEEFTTRDDGDLVVNIIYTFDQCDSKGTPSDGIKQYLISSSMQL